MSVGRSQLRQPLRPHAPVRQGRQVKHFYEYDNAIVAGLSSGTMVTPRVVASAQTAGHTEIVHGVHSFAATGS